MTCVLALPKGVGPESIRPTAAERARRRLGVVTRVQMCDSDTTPLQASPRRMPDVGASRLQAARSSSGCRHRRLERRRPVLPRVRTTLGDKMPAEDNTIRPFQVSFPEPELTELRNRVNATRWPDRETVTDDSQGVRLATMQELARHWGADYDWRRCEQSLNSLPQFMTEIDGLDIQ